MEALREKVKWLINAFFFIFKILGYLIKWVAQNLIFDI